MFSEKHGNILHGILLIALFSCAAFYLADTQPARSLSFSPLILGILLGMLYANSLRNHLPETWVPGILFCSKQLLRAGIVLYGFRLTFQSVAAIGAPAIGIDAAVVAGTLLLGVLLGRALKMDRDLALLTSTGSAICGAAAVLGAEPVVKAAPHKKAVAVSTVVIFGTVSMFLYPALWRAGILGLTPEQMGLYTGATLHEVAHVVGVGNAMGAEIADGAVIVKMIRVMMLAPVLLVMRPAARPPHEGRCGPREGHDPVVRVRVPGRHRIQFARPAARGGGGGNQFVRHLPADDGHDGAGGGDQHRKVQTRRRETLPPRRTALPVAAGRRLSAEPLDPINPAGGTTDGLPPWRRVSTAAPCVPRPRE